MSAFLEDLQRVRDMRKGAGMRDSYFDEALVYIAKLEAEKTVGADDPKKDKS